MALTLSRAEPVDLVRSIQTIRDTGTDRRLAEGEHHALVIKFVNNINHPGGTDLIYYPELIEGYPKDREPTADETVDMAMKGI